MSDGVTMAALANLPPAEIIEPLDYQAIVAREVSTFADLWAEVVAADPTQPAYDTLLLKSDPGRKQIDRSAWSELNLRARINDAARANLLYYAWGTNIDHVAFDHDVVRLSGEEGNALKERVVLATAGRSPAGPYERYEAIARGTDVRVAAAHAYRIGRDPTIYVAIYSTDNAGVPDADLLARVDARLQARSVKPGNATIITRAAVFAVEDVTYDVWLLPGTPAYVLDQLPIALRAAWDIERAMGRDLVAEWMQAKLTLPGVYKAVVTSGTVIAEPYQALSIGTITPNYRGQAT